MKLKASDLFATIRSEGGLLPPDLLQRVAEGDSDLKGLKPADYHLAAGERINEAINRSWNRMVGAWRGFRAALDKVPEGEPGTTITREKWLLVLFHELGYGRLIPARASEIEGESYPISHFWKATPIHLIGAHVDLDRKAKGVAGAARMSPHGLVQVFLNRSDDHLWGFVSNGLSLRVLRDNASLTRQAFVEFDLESMIDGEVYPDFVVLWLLCHQSRVEADKPEEGWLEKWTKAAAEQGTRALDSLRDGVQAAIEALGQGFLAHPTNTALREKLRSGTLAPQDLYRQLLRLAYRLLFLFVTEDRGLIHVPNAGDEAKERYNRFYSTRRLRRLAERHRGTKHPDLYQVLRLVSGKLNDDDGCRLLGLYCLGGFLWSPEAVADLHAAELSNRYLLDAIRELAFTQQGRLMRAVDYKNLGSEEFGGVYESLLELNPKLNLDPATLVLEVAAGHERKTTGSYYTPVSLIQCLLDSAIDPVLDEAVTKKDPEEAILSLRVCDPACGSGHFLIAAAHRIAHRLAALRTGDAEPSPDATRTALRDAIGGCVYGVDVNPMAVELCKVSLWIEALEPGRPLSFLDHHIKCGNSVIGATPRLVARGIPDEAFKPIEGDDKTTASALRKTNKQERQGQTSLFPDLLAEALPAYGSLADSLSRLEELADDSVAAVRRKKETYERLVNSDEYQEARIVADAWSASFFVEKTPEMVAPLTHDTFRRIAKDPKGVSDGLLGEVERLASKYKFFHWHLEFPEVCRLPEEGDGPDCDDVGWSGGFDVVLGNPPWDTLSPDAKEFFSAYDPQVRFQDSDGQKRVIKELLGNDEIAHSWSSHRRDLYAAVHFFKNGGRYRLFAPGNLGKGDFNVFRMFVETALQLTAVGGIAAQVVPEGFYNGANCMAIRKELFEHFSVGALLGFENSREVWFKGIDSRTKFALYSAKRPGRTVDFSAAFNIRSPQQLVTVTTGEALSIPVDLVREFSPDALAVMEFGSQKDIDIATKMYSKWPKFGDESAGPPVREYMREIDMGSDRERFSEDPNGIPLYEGRMVGQYDHRAKGYRSGRGRAAVWDELPFDSLAKSIQPQWHIPSDQVPEKAVERIGRYRVAFCDVASPTNERTLVAALIPAKTIAGHSAPTFVYLPGEEWAYCVWLAVANSFSIDFLARQKVSLHMTFTVLDSLPFPRFTANDPLAQRLGKLALQLTCTGREMIPLWNCMSELGWVPSVPRDSLPPGLIAPADRAKAQADIDAVVAAQVFGLARDELAHVLETFPIVKKRDLKQHDEYLTKHLILESYDRLAADASEHVTN